MPYGVHNALLCVQYYRQQRHASECPLPHSPTEHHTSHQLLITGVEKDIKRSGKDRWREIHTPLTHSEAFMTDLIKGIGRAASRASFCSTKPSWALVWTSSSTHKADWVLVPGGAGPQCWAPGQLFPQCPRADWQKEGEEGAGMFFFGSPSMLLHIQTVLISDCLWQALQPSGNTRNPCHRPNCPSTNMSSKLLDHVKALQLPWLGLSCLCLRDKSFGAQIRVWGEKTNKRQHANTIDLTKKELLARSVVIYSEGGFHFCLKSKRTQRLFRSVEQGGLFFL